MKIIYLYLIKFAIFLFGERAKRLGHSKEGDGEAG